MTESLKKEATVQGGVLLSYWAVLQLSVMAFGAGNGWGYVLTAALGLALLLLWKKPAYLRKMLKYREEPMPFGGFFALFCLIVAAQSVAQLSAFLAERLAGASLTAQGAVDAQQLPGFLYVCVLAPVAEEWLLRGLCLRAMAPYGKKFAVLVSAAAFGLLHGNPVQAPYAFLVGLILGYTALRYGLVWAMALHLGNNFLFAYALPRLLSGLPGVTQAVAIWSVILICAAVGICVAAANFGPVHAWLREEPKQPGKFTALFRSWTVIAFLLVSILCMVLYFFGPI